MHPIGNIEQISVKVVERLDVGTQIDCIVVNAPMTTSFSLYRLESPRNLQWQAGCHGCSRRLPGV